MQRPDEASLNEEDVELLQQVENLDLTPEQQEAVKELEGHLEHYGKLSTSDRKAAKRLLK